MAAGVKVPGAWHRLLQGTGEIWVLMRIEKPKRLNDKGESRDAGHRRGRIRSSEDAAVMAAERRNSVIYTSRVKQPEMGGFDEGRKVV